LETSINVNIEEGGSKQQLSQIRELYFGQYEVFVDFGKANSEWFDGRSEECLVIDPRTYSSRDIFIKDSRMCNCYKLVEFDLKIDKTSGHIWFILRRRSIVA